MPSPETTCVAETTSVAGAYDSRVGACPGGPADLEELGRADAELAEAGAEAILTWAAKRFGESLVVASSFQDAVLVDLVGRVVPATEVVFLDTGAHFPETLEYIATIRSLYPDLRLTVLEPAAEADAWPCGSDRCCELRKVAPLQRLLAGRQAWVTGLKRVDTPDRQDAPVVGWDEPRGVAKVNPLATWSEEDVDRYVVARGLPEHPLAASGYRSIGCAPTTRPIGTGEDPRAGRWPGTTKTECGLHL
ncbi:MAG: phosphoadenylyl-sulfate reductase [Acidimicrobiales bacterium]